MLKTKLVGKLLAPLMAAILITGCETMNLDFHPSSFNDAEDAVLYKDVPHVSLKQVYNDLRKNEAAAKKKWSGEVIAVTGTVTEVGKLDGLPARYLQLTMDEVGSDCTAVMATDESTIKKQMNSFSVGTKVRAYGIINDMYLSKSLFAPTCVYNLEVGRIEAAQ